MNGLARNINDSHKILFYCEKLCWKLVGDFETIRNNLVYYRNNDEKEGRIGLFNSYTYSVEEIAKFHDYVPYKVATTQNKVNSYARYFE